MKYQIKFKNEVGDWEDTGTEINDLRKASAEARDLQRILDKDKKEVGCCYAVFKETTKVYQANGY